MAVGSGWKRALAIGLALAGATGAAAATPPPAPKLIVVIAVDQLPADLFGRYRERFTGGMKRLADGVVFPDGYQSHAATEICPGHSTILTGRHPAATGIVANSWFDRKTGSSVYCVAVRGTADPDARGPQNLKVATFGDWLKAAQPGARVIAVSGKDRAAIMLGGHHADAVYWWVDGQGFRTSPFAGPAGPGVTAPAEAFDRALFARWRVTPPALWPAAPAPDCAPLARPHRFGQLMLSGTVPPDAAAGVETGDDYSARTDFQDQLRVSPIFDPLALDFASSLIDADRLGRGAATDLLAIGLSSTDHIGHRYGNGGAEMCAQMHALDRALGTFMAKLDTLDVPYVVALTADHGSVDAAERLTESGIAARRIDGAALLGELNAHLRQALGIAYDPIVGDDPQQLFINVAGGDAASRARVRDEAMAWLRGRREVARIFTADEIAAAAPPKGKPADRLSLAERFHESYVDNQALSPLASRLRGSRPQARVANPNGEACLGVAAPQAIATGNLKSDRHGTNPSFPPGSPNVGFRHEQTFARSATLAH